MSLQFPKPKIFSQSTYNPIQKFTKISLKVQQVRSTNPRQIQKYRIRKAHSIRRKV